MPKNILIFSDGTGQAGGISLDERRSNIYKLYRATQGRSQFHHQPRRAGRLLRRRPWFAAPERWSHQDVHPHRSQFLSEATGFGLTTNIIDCYKSIIRLWRPGDRIYLFGFSRGAYTARCVAGVLAHCGVPTRLENGLPMKYDSATAHRLAKIAVKKVYQHTASVPLAKATPRQKELMEQRNELARQFRETYALRQDDGSDYPFFIGVFDTVAAIASKASWSLISLAWLPSQPLLRAAFRSISRLLESCWVHRFAGCSRGSPRFSDSTSEETGGIGLSPCWPSSPFDLIWYVIQQVKFAPRADPEKPWRTLNMFFGRMRFEDKTLNDNVRYARHAIAIDENRAAFARVGWGGSHRIALTRTIRAS